MFSHVCWQSRVGDVQHSFTSAGGRCAGPQGGRGARTPAPSPTPGRGGTQGPQGAIGRREQSRKQQGCCGETEGHTDGYSQRARNKGDRIREGSLGRADPGRAVRARLAGAWGGHTPGRPGHQPHLPMQARPKASRWKPGLQSQR